MRRPSREARRHLRDFWKAWQEERQRMWEEDGPPGSGGPHGHGRHGGPPRPGWPPGPFGGPPPPLVAKAFHRLFSEFMGVEPENHWAFGGRRFTPWHQGIASFNPFVASLLSKGGGLLPLLVMHFLSDRPRYGNEIMDLISEWTRGQWVANPGAIYPLMDELEVNGFIRGEWEDPDKRTVRIYQLTEEGQQELPRLKSIVQPKLKEAIRALQLMADGLESPPGAGERNGTETGGEPAGEKPPDE